MSDSYKGVQSAEAGGGSPFNAMQFLATQVLNRASTATLVQVKAVTNDGALSPVGFVDVQPMVAQVDGRGDPVPHGVVHNLPYLRIQGGTDAIIIDPKINDIGIVLFADRDISSVKASRAPSTPGSMRRFDMADGLYIGGVLNGTPQQYIQFAAGGITVTSPTKITCNAPTVDVHATTASVIATAAANVTAPAISLGASGQTLLAFVTSAFQSLFNAHTHTSAASGSPTSGPTTTLGPAHMTTTVKGG